MLKTKRAKVSSGRSTSGRKIPGTENTQLLELLKCVAEAANESTSLEQALAHCVLHVCSSMGWKYGHVFIKDENGIFKLGPVAGAAYEDQSAQKFYEITRTLDLNAGNSLPSRVVSTTETQWVSDISEIDWCLRARVAKEAGLKMGVSFPIMIGKEIVAVVEFFSDRSLERHPTIVDVISSIGVQLGRVVERERAAKALLESEKRFRSIAASMRECVITADDSGTITSLNQGGERMLGYAEDEVVGKPFLFLTSEHLRPQYIDDLRCFKETGCSNFVGRSHESELIRKNGQVLPVEVSLSTWKHEENLFFTAVIRDISDRLKSREESNLFFNLAQDLITIIGKDGYVRRANPAHKAVLGYTQEELTHLHYTQLVFPDDLPAAMKEFDKVSRGESVCFECRVKCKDGSIRFLELRGTPSPDTSAFFCVSRDLTARKMAEDKLRESENRFNHLVDNAKEIIYQTDAQGCIEIYNPTAQKVFGYTNQELGGMHYLDFVSPRYRRRAKVFYYRQFAERTHNTYWELPVITKDRREFWVAQSVQIIVEKDKVKGFQVVARDITQRKRMEEALIEARRELELRVEQRTAELAQANASLRAEIEDRKQIEDALRQSQQRVALHVQQTPLGVISWDIDFRVLEWNKAAERIFGYSFEEAKGSNAEMIVPDDAREQVAEIWNKLILNKGGQRSTNENVTKDGRRIVCDWYNTPLINAAGKVIGVSSLVSDITDRVRAEEGLRRAHAELENRVRERTKEILELNVDLQKRALDLEAVNKELESFSYSVSHDLRAPLRAIDGFARIMLEDYSSELDDTCRRYLNIICKSTTQMGQLIDDLLAFSRLGRQSMAMGLIEMNSLVKSLIEDAREVSLNRNIEFIVHPLPNVKGDRSMIRQVLANLLSNALKFTKYKDKAIIEIGAKTDKARTVFYIKDNGAGFDMQYVNKIFGVFQRLHTAEQFEGTGVGLAIVQRVVHRHGGEVWAEGEQEKGATFYFTLG